mmetsp:Transcript_5646/g.13002  ORF Transcript_5646/g.13002 Transcript_5646/m.13002 type:complete len:391 (+) Transcript_5646:244-1416(+)
MAPSSPPALVLVLLTMAAVEGLVRPHALRRGLPSPRTRDAPSSQLVRRVRIIGDDASSGEERSLGMGTQLFNDPDLKDPDSKEQIKEDLNHDHKAELARIVATQSSLKLSAIEQVHANEVAEDHVEIQAMSCAVEDGQCVGLDINVPLPHPCNGFENEGDFEECVLENIAELSAMFNEKSEEADYDVGADMREWAEDYKSTELAETAARMQNIMNGFAEELTILLKAAERDTFLVPSPPDVVSVEMQDLTPNGFGLTAQLESGPAVGLTTLKIRIDFDERCASPDDFQQRIMSLVARSEITCRNGISSNAQGYNIQGETKESERAREEDKETVSVKESAPSPSPAPAAGMSKEEIDAYVAKVTAAVNVVAKARVENTTFSFYRRFGRVLF